MADDLTEADIAKLEERLGDRHLVPELCAAAREGLAARKKKEAVSDIYNRMHPPQARSETVEQGHIVICADCGKAFDATDRCDPSCWCKPWHYLYAPASDASPGERLVAAAEEALAIARGEKEPAAVHRAPTIDAAMQEKRCNHFPGQSECDWCRPTTDAAMQDDAGTKERPNKRTNHVGNSAQSAENRTQFVAQEADIEADTAPSPEPSVVSEGEPTPGLKCEPSGDRIVSADLVNGLQPQPSVGEAKPGRTRFSERNYTAIKSRLSEAQAEIERLKDCSDDYKRLANDRKIQLLDAQDTINQWKETAEHATSQHAKSVQILQAEIERWNNMAQHNREAYDELEAIVKRYREALEAMVYEATHLSPQEANGDHKCRISAATLRRARQALTDGESGE